MKYLTTALTLSALLAAPAFSEGMRQHNAGAQAGPTQMQTSEASDMHEQMQKMKSLMERLNAEQNPEAREQLMQEHMQAMEDGMQMMNKGMDNGPDMGSMSMDKRMVMTSERMDMMQMMMEQMMGQMKGQKSMEQ